MPRATSTSGSSSGREPVALFYNELFLKHEAPFSHPESPERLRAILSLLRESGAHDEVDWAPFKAASEEDIEAVHHERLVRQVLEASMGGGRYLDPDTYTNTYSYDAAMLAAGALKAAVDAVLGGEYRRAFALVRPPGHHATPDRAMGFCLFNNVAVGVRHAQRAHGVQRAFIVDWDVHHGNGTQDVFYEDPDVFFFSVHQYGAFFYPGTGAMTETGAGPGKGTTANVPLPAGMTDAVYQEVWNRILIPLIRRWQPEIIFISAGYDAHWRDPLAGMRLSVSGFGWLATQLLRAADELGVPVVATLEGGYNLEALALSVLATVRAMQGAPLPEDALGIPDGGPPSRDVLDLLDHIRAIHQI